MAQMDFSTQGIDPMQTFTPLPNGRYKLVVSETDVKETKAGTGHYLLVVADVDGAEYAGRKVFLRFNVDNPNATAEEIGKRELAALLGAVGIEHLGDSDELLGLMFDADIVIEKNKNDGREGNKAVGYYAAEGAAAGAAAAKPTYAQAKGKPATAPAAKAVAPWTKKAAA